ncbi:MAG TPA: hypothetical protein VIY72_13680 [Acidimicrobiales bacterium]
MYYVHEVHDLQGGSEAAAEDALRTIWAPAIALEPDTRLVWCARSMPGAASYPELVTLTAVADAGALERFSSRLRDGDLGDADRQVSEHREGVVRRIVAPMIFDPLEFDLAAIPSHPTDNGRESFAYIHDFVPPRHGMQRPYEIAMRDVFSKMMESPDVKNVSWAGLETVAGGGPTPESIMITKVMSADAGTRMLTAMLTAEHVTPGSWLYDALKLRDTWTSRLLRSVAWSPLV